MWHPEWEGSLRENGYFIYDPVPSLFTWNYHNIFNQIYPNTKKKKKSPLLRENQFSSVQSLSRVWLFATPWTAQCQAFLSITNSQNLPKLMSIESMRPSSFLILCHPLLLPPSIFPSIRVFSNESVLHIRWPKYWSFSEYSVPMNIQDWFPLDGLVGYT